MKLSNLELLILSDQKRILPIQNEFWAKFIKMKSHRAYDHPHGNKRWMKPPGITKYSNRTSYLSPNIENKNETNTPLFHFCVWATKREIKIRNHSILPKIRNFFLASEYFLLINRSKIQMIALLSREKMIRTRGRSGRDCLWGCWRNKNGWLLH